VDKQLAERFRALADPTRLAVVQALLQGPASVSNLARPHAMALPPFMKHLRCLEEAGIIATRKEGRVRLCSINPQAMAEIDRWFADRRKFWHGRLARLSAHLSEKPTE